ncbi:peptidoglycan recognition protein family protein [Jonesia quinghaiensis]|uniref:peptidoglycan recognition protein family protein n=1 Tax=Jonesia quinghaiensis TaxID=262806 RepID=UPI00041B8D10|nr:peptidoglycan recognition protein [Jonesia quinghaiensis]
MRRTTVVAISLALAGGGVVAPVVSWQPTPAQAAEVNSEEISLDGVDADALEIPDVLEAVTDEPEVPSNDAVEAQFLGGVEPQQESVPTSQGEVLEENIAAITVQEDVAPFLLAGVTWDSSSDATVMEVAVKVHEESGWTDWQSLEILPVGESDDRAGVEPLLTSGADGVQVRVLTSSGEQPADLSVELIDPGSSPMDTWTSGVSPDSAALSSAQAAGSVARPAIVPRETWMAKGAEKYTTWRPVQSARLNAMYIHHTAGSSTYTKAQAAAQVRAIYSYHARTLGWGDIGYNFLVDRFGTIYEGRKGSIDGIPKGAHAGNYNDTTIGVSAMGNFENITAPTAMTNSMVNVLAWKGAQYGINATGTTTLRTGTAKSSSGRAKPGSLVEVPTIAAHRDTNYTACPGRNLTSRMSSIRTSVSKKIAASRVPAVAAPKVSLLSSKYRPIALNTNVPLTWGAVSNAVSYEVGVKQAKHGGLFSPVEIVTNTTSLSHVVKLPTAVSARMYVRAVAADGKRSKWSAFGTLTRSVPSSALKRTSGTWTRVTSSKFYRNFAFQSRVKDSRIKIYGTRDVRTVQMVVGKGKGYGRVAVYAGTKRIKTVSLNASKKTYASKVTLKLPEKFSGTITIKTLDNKPVRVSAVTAAR